ncbi:MAG TPA: UDP-N-acetylmuramoyl-L-alanyl-D-glutamate--2,6-diaminopimelate ligase [Peptococcaceae bacterium]|nr:UDP-N-acetylmuramoyl-L-alanyl-D-glutamate--2,6-diaminopimelate ligase [Peptococcaceae bacterium]
MLLEHLARYTNDIIGWQQGLDWQQEVLGITSDSRQVKKGYLFVALKGEKSDGHDYIKQALQQGACAVVIEDPARRREDEPWILARESRKALGEMLQGYLGSPSLRMRVIGVTGTNGKTTVTNMIAHILEEGQKKVGLMGTIHNRIGQKILPGSLTTPDCLELAGLFAEMAAAQMDYAVMEVSSHALAQNRVAGVEFDLGVFTNLTQDHLDFHGTMEEYLAQKSRLFSGLDPLGKKGDQKMAILNRDDPSCDYLSDRCRVPFVTYGLDKRSMVRAENVQLSSQGIQYDLKYINKMSPIRMKVHGQFNVYNSLAAIAVTLVEGIPIETIQRALEAMEAVPGRFQRVEAEAPYSVFVDYSHTPDSLKNCILTAREFCRERIITVFGAGGHRDRAKRPLMGEIAARLSDICIVTSDNPRDEDPEDIMEDILKGIKGDAAKTALYKEVDRRKAIRMAIELAEPGDVVLICGKGHEDYQIIGDQKHHFDDREEAQTMINERQKKRHD